MNNNSYLIALHLIDGLGPIRLKSLIDHFGDPKSVWEADGRKLKELGIPFKVVELLLETRKKLDPEEYAKSIEDAGIKWLTIFDEAYPKLLKEIYDPPMVIYYRGEFKPEDEKAVAVVGTRKITGYGKLVTEKFTKELVAAGLTIVSGLARGVDSEAHKATLEVGGRTIAVLGGGLPAGRQGLKNIFPPENTRLAADIADGHGAVVSEFPPDYPSLPGNFPARNRIISGLSLGVLVTEAAKDSGSLITARLALEQGREVFAVPGPVTSDLSRGPADLIKEGARLVFEPGEILEELGINTVMSDKGKVISGDLTQQERKIVECLENESRHLDEICRLLNFSAAETSATLLKLEIQGVVRNLGGGIYCKG